MKQAIIDLWNDLQSANGKIGKLASYCHDHDSEKTGTTNVVDGLSTTSALSGGGNVIIDGGWADGAVTLYYGKTVVLTDVGKVSKTDEVESAGAET